MNYSPSFIPPSELDIFTVYYIEGCPHCNATRKKLNEFTYQNEPLKFLLLDVDELCNNDRNKFWRNINPYLNNKPHKTFPVIFLNQRLVGGNSDLQKLLNEFLIKNK